MIDDMGVAVIQSAQEYDGDGWVCYAPGDDRGTGYGDTPELAYADWLNPDSKFKYWTQGKGAGIRLGIDE